MTGWKADTKNQYDCLIDNMRDTLCLAVVLGEILKEVKGAGVCARIAKILTERMESHTDKMQCLIGLDRLREQWKEVADNGD